MARHEHERQDPQPPDRFIERRGIDVIEPERPPAATKLPEPPPPREKPRD